MPSEPKSYDLVVIGGGPAGINGATTARILGKTVALVDRHHELGGAGANTGTVPSKTLRETALAIADRLQFRRGGVRGGGVDQRMRGGADFRLPLLVEAVDLRLIVAGTPRSRASQATPWAMLPALVVQLTIAMAHSPPRLPLGQKANWLVMAAWLLLLRSHLLLPPPPRTGGGGSGRAP